MTETMQALVVLEPEKFEIQEVPVPEPGPMEVLCRVKAVSICGTDSHLIAGDYPGFWPPAFPIIPGHEWAGEIVALGPGAEKAGWAVGDRVAGTSHDACGVCQQCVEGRYNLCENYGVMDLHRQYGHNPQNGLARAGERQRQLAVQDQQDNGQYLAGHLELAPDGRRNLDAALAEDQPRREDCYAAIHALMWRDQPYTWLFYRNAYHAFNKKLRGYNFSPRGVTGYGPGFSSWWVPADL